jgi:hypothetical protein
MRWDAYVVTAMLASLVIAGEAVYAMANYHRTRTFGLITVLGVVAFPVAVVIHNVLSAMLGTEEAVSFILGAVIAPAAITSGALGMAFTLHATNAVAGAGFAMFGAGLAIFPVYLIATLVLSAVGGGEALRQEAFAATMPPVSLAILTAGVIVSAFGLAMDTDGTRQAAV